MVKKVVHIIIGLNVGGAELMLKRLVLHSQEKKEFQHSVISLTDIGVIGSELKSKGIPVYSLGMQSAVSTPIVLLKIRKLLKELQPDVVQTWMYHADFLGGLAAKSMGIKNIIWGIRNSEIDSNSGLIKKSIRKSCAKLSRSIPSTIVCVAHKAKEVHARVGYDQSKIKVIPNGFNLDKFTPDKSKRLALRSQIGIQGEDLVIGNIGRFTPAKNHLNFIRACLILLDKGYDFKVLMCGRDVELNNPEIFDLFADNNHSSQFIFLGEVSDTSSFYNAIDVFCLCSYTEGFPNVLGEAMATEKVCLTTDAGDAQLILDNCGFNIESSSHIDIARAIEDNILKGSKNELKNIATEARTVIQSEYSLDKIVSEFEMLYT